MDPDRKKKGFKNFIKEVFIDDEDEDPLG